MREGAAGSNGVKQRGAGEGQRDDQEEQRQPDKCGGKRRVQWPANAEVRAARVTVSVVTASTRTMDPFARRWPTARSDS